jgi:hypothetical protein
MQYDKLADEAFGKVAQHMIFRMAVAVMLLPVAAVAAQAMTREEATARAAYASVVLASRVHSLMGSRGDGQLPGQHNSGIVYYNGDNHSDVGKFC